MKGAGHPRMRFLLAFIGIVAVVAALVLLLSRVSRNNQSQSDISSKPQPSNSNLPSASPVQTLSPALSIHVSPSAESVTPLPDRQTTPAPVTPSKDLIVPVAGVRPDQLRDTFADARSEGRVHDAIDIAAPRGTPVMATADGTIIKLFQSDRGGTTIYQLSADRKFFYYYAHLDRYADALAEGQTVKQGQTIGYVGDSGNAGAGNYHLHFSVSIVSDPKRYWQGVNINPYPLLKK